MVGSRVVGSRFGVVDGCGLGVIRSRGGMVRGGSGVVDGLGVIGSGGRVVRSGLRVVGLVMGFAFVFDISDVSVFVVSVVGHDLGSAVGKGNTVLAGHNTVVILGLLFAEVGASVFVLHSVFVGEGPGGQLVFGGGVVRSGFVNWGWVVGSGFGSVVGRGSGMIRSGMIGSGMVGSDVSSGDGGHGGQH